MLSVPDHPLRLKVFLYISQSPLTSVRSAVQFKLLPWLFVLHEDRNGLPAWSLGGKNPAVKTSKDHAKIAKIACIVFSLTTNFLLIT